MLLYRCKTTNKPLAERRKTMKNPFNKDTDTQKYYDFSNTVAESIHSYDGDYGQYNLQYGFGDLDPVESFEKDYVVKALYYKAGYYAILKLNEDPTNFELTEQERQEDLDNRIKVIKDTLTAIWHMEN